MSSVDMKAVLEGFSGIGMFLGRLEFISDAQAKGISSTTSKAVWEKHLSDPEGGVYESHGKDGKLFLVDKEKIARDIYYMECRNRKQVPQQWPSTPSDVPVWPTRVLKTSAFQQELIRYVESRQPLMIELTEEMQAELERVRQFPLPTMWTAPICQRHKPDKSDILKLWIESFSGV